MARTKSGEQVVGHRDRLELPGRALRWEEILSASWDDETETLRVMLVEPEVVELELDEPALLLQLVRERVQASVVLSRRGWVTPDLGLRVMARRPPSGGTITFAVEYDPGMDPDDPDARRIAAQTLRAAREELGL